MIINIANKYLSKDGVVRGMGPLFIWSSIGIVFDKIGVYLAVFLSAQLIDVSDFGKWGISYSSATSLQVFVVLGGGVVLSKFFAAALEVNYQEAIDVLRVTLSISIFTVTLAYLALLLNADNAAKIVSEKGSPILLVSAFAVWAAVLSFSTLLQSATIAYGNGKTLALSATLTGMLYCVLVPLGGWKFGYKGMILGATLVEGLRLTILGISLRSYMEKHSMRLIGKVNTSTLEKVLKFSVPVLLQAGIYVYCLWQVQIWLIKRSSQGIEEMAGLSLCLIFYSIILMASSLINRVALPYLSKTLINNPKKYHLDLKYIVCVQLIIGLVLAALIYLFRYQFLPEKYLQFAPVLSALCIAAILTTIQTAVANALLLLDKEIVVLLTIIPWAIVLLCLVWFSQNPSAQTLSLALVYATALRTALIIGSYVNTWRMVQRGMKSA